MNSDEGLAVKKESRKVAHLVFVKVALMAVMLVLS